MHITVVWQLSRSGVEKTREGSKYSVSVSKKPGGVEGSRVVVEKTRPRSLEAGPGA